ncbi:MAG: DUF3822 family protein [Bacteroidetes bacterium]|nr:DUF3822 family protein [Bacteroidota bacterium]MDA0887966.1 DUF3822 family protein [Bacteroidota bacterium]MDA1083920.1 DUF3822 family protein [Bacteroidota bacterium]
MQEHNNKTSNSNTILSIHVHVNGLSFFTHDPKTKKASPLVKKTFTSLTPIEKLHEEIFNVLKAQQLTEKSFREVYCSVENNLVTLVPKVLFEENALEEYVRKDIVLEKNDFITYDIIPSVDWVTVYVPFVNINNMLIDAFGSFKYYHAVSIWLKALTSHSKADGTLVWSMYKENNHVHIALLRDNKLQFYNCFEAANPKDLAYYVLLSAKENQLNPNEVPLFLVGDIVEADNAYKALHTFVRSLNFLTPEHSLEFQTQKLHTHQDFCVLNLL